MDKEKVKTTAMRVILMLQQRKFTEVETVALLKTIAELMNDQVQKLENEKDENLS